MSAAEATGAQAAAAPRPLTERRKLAIFLVMAIGQFMAVLDIQIVAASLSSIQAGLSAGLDEIDWVQTAYLMAEVVMIPLSAFLARAFSTRWMFVAAAGLFTLSSLLCGAAWDLPSLIAFRVIQGFFGGAMIPLVFATGFAFFAGSRAAVATAVLGLISTLAPALGPTLGGAITDAFSWRWLFFINAPAGLVVTGLLIWLGPIDKAEPSLIRRIDWLHAASLTVSLGGLQYVLEEGPRRQWFGDASVAAIAWTALVAGAVFIERCFYSKHPLVAVTPFRRKGFAASCLLSFALGAGLYASVYLTPVFLAQVRGYSSLAIGATVSVTGLFMTLAAAPAAWLAHRIDQRIVAAIGFALYALSFWMMSDIGPDWGFWQLFWPQAVRGAAVLFTMVPVVGLALSGAPADELREASSLNNLMRNLGGAVGIAVVNTGLLRFFDLHATELALSAGRAPQAAAAALGGLAGRFGAAGYGPARAPLMAAATLDRGLSAQALSLAFDDVFRLGAAVLAACVLIAPFCRGGPMTPAQRLDGAQDGA